MSAQELITEHLDLWTEVVTKKSTSGRGSNGKLELTGIKKLRELILELAVRGKLLEQDPNDEPANILLKRAIAEKRHLEKQGKIKKRRKLPKLSEMTIPFHLPPNWEWAQLEDIGHDWGQKIPSNNFSYIDVSSIDNLKGVITQPSILTAQEAPSRARKVVREGTLIYSTVRPYLQNIAVVAGEINPEPIASTAFAILHPVSGMSSQFFLHYLRSPVFVRYVETVQTGIAYPAINDKQFFSGLVPVPPLEEQHRIVQKVDELIALCDQLEQQTSDQLAAHETLVDTLLGTLTQSENATELADNWVRLSTYFDTLFTTEQSIDKLKQTILQLAVMGRLVEQDEEMQSAKDGMRLIDLRKSELEMAGVIKKDKPLQDISLEELPARIPKNWAVTRFGRIALKITDGAHHTPTYVSQGVPFLSVKDMSSGVLDFSDTRYISEEQHRELSRRCAPAKGDLLITKVGTTGIPVLVDVDREFSIFVSVALVKFPTDLINGSYLCLLVASPWVKKQSEEGTEGVGNKNLVLKKIRNFVLPIPPLEEQALIVKKVDELMALCDQLKERLNQASATRSQLAEAVVKGALN